MAVNIQLRRGTTAEWVASNPTLSEGEVGVETDTKKLKIGDGLTVWSSLPYINLTPAAAASIYAPIANPTFTGTVTGVTKSMVGLGSVDNTADASKPVSTATQTALNLKAPLASPTFTGIVSLDSSLVFEGATADAYETTLTVVDPTADRTITFPDATGTVVLADSSGNVTISGNATIQGVATVIQSTILEVQNEVKFEGSTADAFETSLKVIDPTADRVINLPDASGTVALTSDITVSASSINTFTNKSISLTTNSISGTKAEFNSAMSDADFATLAGTETLTNKSLTSPSITTPTGITKSDVGLANVDNTTDANKPISTATQAALDAKQAVVANVSDTEIGYLDGVTSGIQTQINNKQAIVANVSDTEIGYLDGVTSSIQTQIDTKLSSATASATYAPLASPTFTGTVTLPANTISQTHLSDDSVGTNEIGGLAVTNGKLAGDISWDKLAISSTVSAIEAGYLDGVTASIQTQLNGKQAIVANVNDVEIGYLDGVTSSIQTQINDKAPTASPTFTGTVSGITKTMVGLGSVDNTADTAKPVSTLTQTALDLKAPLNSPTFTGTVSGITKTMVGLGDVNNTSDASKPISTLTQTALDLKLASATAASTYETISNVALKAPLASPGFTGVPTAPTAALATNTTQVATTAFVRAEVAALVGSAGATLDTLGEIATALGNDANLSTTLTSSIALKAPLASPTFTGTVTLPTGTVTSAMILDGTIVDADINASAAIAQSKISGLSTSLGLKADLASPTFTGTVTIPAGASISGFAPLASPTFTGTNTVAALTVSGSGLITASSAGVAFTDGTQTKEGVPSRTPIIQKTAAYTLSALTERDSLIEVSSATGVTVTIPTNTAVAYPIGTSIDILQTGAGQVTIAPVDGTVTVNATPGLKLRTTWSSCTLFKRATNTWVVYGDLTA